MNDPIKATPPKGIGPLARKEMSLAYTMLLPTFLIVLAIVLFPLLTNFWISFKPVQLADLRAPTIFVRENMRGKPAKAGDEVTIEYKLRNSSKKSEIYQAILTDKWPEGINPTELDKRAQIQDGVITFNIGDVEGGYKEKISIKATVDQKFIDNPVEVKDSEPVWDLKTENILTNSEFTLDNFKKIFSNDEFWGVFKVSMYYTIFGTIGALVLGLFAANLLSVEFTGRNIMRGLFLFPYVAPVIAVAFTWVVLLDAGPGGTLNALLMRMGAIDSPINFFGQRAIDFNIFGINFEFPLALTTVIAFEAWRYFPLSFLFILARMQSIPTDMYEAAEVDGASPLQQFWYISLPQLAGILGVLFLLRFIWTFNKFDDIFLLTGGASGTRTLVVDVYEKGFAISNLGAGAAVAVVVFIVLITSSLLFFKLSPKDE